jgi:ABC-2 type transport system permease protein
VREVLRAELRKITTTRLWWILLVAVFVLGGAYAALPATTALLAGQAGDVAPPFNDPGVVRSVYNGGNPGSRILALVLGITAVGTEYRHHTFGSSYLATPRRARLLLGKAVTLLVFGLLYGLVSVAAGVLVAVGFVTSQNGTFFLDDPVTWRFLALGVLAIGLWAIFGMGIGLLIRQLLVALLVGIAFVALIEPGCALILYLSGSDLALNLTPSGATNALLGITSSTLFAGSAPYAWWQAALVLATWCLLPAVVGVLTAVRRDVA